MGPLNQIRRRITRTQLFLIVWLFVIAIYLIELHRRGLTPTRALLDLLDLLKMNFWGPVLFVLLFLARPFILLPATILAVLAGYTHGGLRGALLTLFSALVAASAGYILGLVTRPPELTRANENLEPHPANSSDSWVTRLRENPFQAVLMMRLMMLPFDPCSFLAGRLGISISRFLLATLLGNMPGTITCAFFGAGIQGEFTGQLPQMDYRQQLTCLAVVILLILTIAWAKKRNSAAGKCSG